MSELGARLLRLLALTETLVAAVGITTDCGCEAPTRLRFSLFDMELSDLMMGGRPDMLPAAGLLNEDDVRGSRLLVTMGPVPFDIELLAEAD